MTVERRAVETLDDSQVATLAANARRRWQRLIDMTDQDIAEHVVRSMSQKSPHQVLCDIHEAYRDAHGSGAVDTYLLGMAQVATIAARGLGEPVPQWLRGTRS